MKEIIDIRYTTKTFKGYRDTHLIRCFENSIISKNDLKNIENLILRTDVISVLIEKYEVND